MQTAKSQLGALGERVAIKYLKNKKYQIITTNFTNSLGRRIGEIDIIARDTKENELVFVEVKTRDYQKYHATLPEENITYHKLQRLLKIAQVYLKMHSLIEHPYRFDAISVWIDRTNKKARIKHLERIYL